MTETDKQLLIELEYGVISQAIFLKRFSVDIKNDAVFVQKEMEAAIKTGDSDEIQMTISLIWLAGDHYRFLDLLNELLINPNHQGHQTIGRALQEIANPATIPFVQKALDTNFDYLEYTCSETSAIAKWFSWLLYAIGTKEAVDVIKKYSLSANTGIKEEMLYRLKKIKNDI